MQCCWNSKVVLQNFDFTFYMSRQICSLVREGSCGHVATSCLTQQLEAHLSLRGDLRGTSLRDCSRRENVSWSFSQSGHGELFVCCLFTRLKQGRLWRSKKHSSRYLAFFFGSVFVFLSFFICKTHSLFYPPLRSHFQVILQGRSPLCPLTHVKICITPEAEQQQQQH